LNAVAAAPSRKGFDGVINRLTVFIPAASAVNRELAEVRHGVAYRAAVNDADIDRGAFAAVVVKRAAANMAERPSCGLLPA